MTSPFGEPVPSIALDRPPLALVVAQVRFPVILSIDDGSATLAQFQDRIRDGYPDVKQTTELSLSLAGAQVGPQELIKGKVWHFSDPDTGWEVSVANSFVALSTQRYTHRDDFISRLGRLLDNTLNVLRPTMAQRVGVRYSARIDTEGQE
ncbi:MAG: TIGR04255 family protein, partial [Candidatus Dormibacteria bacterium]